MRGLESYTDGFLYKQYAPLLQELYGLLVYIKNNINSANLIKNENISHADEILKYKNLLEAEAITQEEFEAKKKQILGLD